MKRIASRFTRIVVGTFLPPLLFSIVIFVSYTNFKGDNELSSLVLSFAPYLMMAYIIGTIPCLIGSILVEFALNPKIKHKTTFIISNIPLGIVGAAIFLSDPLSIFKPEFKEEMSIRSLEILGYGVVVSIIVGLVLRFLFDKGNAIIQARNDDHR